MTLYTLIPKSFAKKYHLQENWRVNLALLSSYENIEQTERDTTANRQSAIDKFISLWVRKGNSKLLIFSPTNNQRQWSNNQIKFAIISLIPVSTMRLSG